MKINKKGLSMVELIVCIVLISIVLLFMFQLLNEVRNETDSNSYVYNNQLNRVDSLYKIDRELHQQKDEISGITINYTTGFDILYYYRVSKKTTHMTITQESNKYYIDYKDYDSNNNRWEMKNAKIDSCGQYTIGKYGTKYFIKLNFYVYNAMDHSLNNKDNNNLVDDLEFVITGDIADIDTSISNNILLKPSGTYNIGNCA